jgi:PKD repeat protein
MKYLFTNTKRTAVLSLLLGSSYLLTLNSCKKEPDVIPPKADFTYSKSSDYAPAQYSFSNKSTDATEWLWDFGDGTTSVAQNPVKTFTTPGNYQITLIAKNQGLQSQVSKTVQVKTAFKKATITKITISKLPFSDPNGAGWDFVNGPDLYLDLLSPNPDNNVLASSNTISDLKETQLPVNFSFTQNYTITNFADYHFIQLMDSDSPDADDEIDYVAFRLSDYTSGSNAYPNYINLSQNKTTATMYISWAP